MCLFVRLTIFAALAYVRAWRENNFAKLMAPIIEPRHLSELLEDHLRHAMSYTFPPGDICFSFVSDNSSYAEEIIKLLHLSPKAPSFLNMPLKFEKVCKSYVVVASDITTLKRIMTHIKVYSKVRIACLIQNATEGELDKTLQHELDIFGDAELSIFGWNVDSTFYRVRQPDRIVEKINYANGTKSIWKYNNFIKNFHRRTIRITTHNCTAFIKLGPIKADKSSDYFIGSDALPLKEIIFRLNLTYEFIKPAPGKLFGEYINNTWVGGLFENLAANKADVVACGSWIDYSKFNTGLEPSYPVRSLCITYLVPRKLARNGWARIFQPLKLSTWLVVTVSWFGLSGVITIVATVINNNCDWTQPLGCRYRSLGRSLFDIYGVIVNGTWPPSKENLGPLRHLIAWWVIFTLLINCCYSSTLISHLTKPTYKSKPKNVHDLLIDGYSWITERDFSSERAWDLSDPVYKGWSLRHVQTTYSNKIKALMSDEKQVIVGLKMSDNLFYPFYDELPDYITNRFDMMDTCTASVYESFIHRAGSPFATSVNRYVVALNQAGLIQLYEKKIAFSKLLPRPVRVNKERMSGGFHNDLSLRDLKGIFVWLILGYVVSLMAFIKELLWVNKRRRVSDKKPIDTHYRIFHD